MGRGSLVAVLVVLAFGALPAPAFAVINVSFAEYSGAVEDPDTVGANDAFPITLTLSRGGAVIATDGPNANPSIKPPGGLQPGDVARVYSEQGAEELTSTYNALPSIDGAPCGFVGQEVFSGSFDPASGPPTAQMDSDSADVSVSGDRYTARSSVHRAIRRFDVVGVNAEYATRDVFGNHVTVRTSRLTACSKPPPPICTIKRLAKSSLFKGESKFSIDSLRQQGLRAMRKGKAFLLEIPALSTGGRVTAAVTLARQKPRAPALAKGNVKVSKGACADPRLVRVKLKPTARGKARLDAKRLRLRVRIRVADRAGHGAVYTRKVTLRRNQVLP